MKNILLSNFDCRRLGNLNDCQAFLYDRQCLYAYDKGIVTISKKNYEEILCNLARNLYPDVEAEEILEILEISYSYEKNLLYLVMINGDIISLDVNKKESEAVVGCVDGGIQAAQWSPDQEVIALVTGNDIVIVMTNEFDPVAEVNLHSTGFGEKQFITVGWGKKETQFRGSEGKFNVTDKKSEATCLIKEDDNKVKLSWRGDAEYFVVSSINPNTCLRYLRIFTKSGILQYTSENLNGLGSCLDWRPSGNLIVSTQKFPNKYNVCFFEKNGLKHGEFTLPTDFNESEVIEVLWTKDSKLLAVVIMNAKNKKCICLYSTSNYHWYLKYVINFSSESDLLFIQWDSQKYNTLHAIYRKNIGIYHYEYSWLWTINKTRGDNSTDESFVAVIDGRNVLLSSFKRGIIPPPMCSYKLQVPTFINSVSFAVNNSGIAKNDLLVHLSDGRILIFKFVDFDKQVQHVLLGEINDLEKNSEFCYNIQWVDENTIVLCSIKYNDYGCKPFLIIVDVKKLNSAISYTKKEILLESSIAIIKSTKSNIIIHDNNKQLFLLKKHDKEVLSFPSNEKKMLIDLEIREKDGCSFYVFSLDILNKFYINDQMVLSNVSSFHIHDQFVLLTTMKHELICLNYTDETILDSLKHFTRKIERGAKLVSSVYKHMKVILQMPRGNLECVQPRALSLFVLGKYLDSLNYIEAFNLMRKQRINLNLLYDHNPNLFADNLDHFIKQINDLQWISLFLSDLCNEDVTKTMYSVIYKNKVDNASKGSKIDFVCELFEKALMRREDADKYLLPILTCYIKRGKIEFLEAALKKIKELKEKESKGIKLPVSFDEAFRYMLYLIDVEELYKIALGMYDFDLVLIIAAKSQKDPKEYLPFLNELKKLEPCYQKFTINKYLKRYDKALTNLVLCDGDDIFSECLSFIKARHLYQSALKLIPKNTDRYKNVCICYGDELVRSRLYEEAGIMYSISGMFKNAIEAYRKSGNWEEVISCITELKLSEDESMELFLDIAIELSDLKQYKKAANVYLDYLKDVEECIRTLSKGKFFGEACRISHLYQRSDLYNSIIVPAISEQADLMQIQISNFTETFIKQKTRLQIVRKQKLEAADIRLDLDGDDLYSDTNTVYTQSNATSQTTNRTYRSAKNRRKQERKLFSLKEGSPYEDLALITSLHTIANNCYDLRQEIKELNTFLIKIRKQEMAETLQKDLGELLTIIEQSKSEIWTPDLMNFRQSYGPEATSNEIAAMHMRSENVTPNLLSLKFAIPPEAQNIKWELEILKN